jgi:hypothetical protein
MQKLETIMLAENEPAIDDATAAFLRLSDHVVSLDRKLNALIEVITALDTRDGANAAALATTAERIDKIGTHEQATRAVAILMTKILEPALDEIRVTARRVESGMFAANAAHRSTLRQCAAMCLATVVVAGMGALVWSGGTRSEVVAALPAACQAVSAGAATCQPVDVAKPVSRSEPASGYADVFRLDAQGRKR